ncbi:MAG TPA: prepilin-type N-terminal cleavage/methylation domain-containing protein [Pontiellaceae bacterium]|nr:prepilin-type N-terminal cleavage/methylation domain-containing protein [Pontiellaceae bacterium]
MKTDRQKGVTLIELMVTIAAASILMLMVALILMMAFQSWRINNAYADLRRDAALAFVRMVKDVREADYTGLTAGNPLTLPSAVTNKTVLYNQPTGGKTLLYSDGSGSSIIIPDNVRVFTSVKQDDGVLLSLELANTNFNIAITNEVFVNTRN